MPKIAVVGICGKSIFLNVDHFHQNGETLMAENTFEEIGGKGLNQAVAAVRMGAEVSFLAAIGDDECGKSCKKMVEENNIKGFFSVKKGIKTTFAVILADKHGENQVTCYQTANLTKEDVLTFEEEIASSDILLLQHEVPDEANEMAVELANKHKVKIILNPAPIREISDKIAKSVFAVTPNQQEKQAINPERFKNCITTLGKNGCDINGEIGVSGINVKAVNTTGAGDTFNGVFTVCVAEGMDLETACKYAVTASGLSVTKNCVVNSIPTRKEIEKELLK